MPPKFKPGGRRFPPKISSTRPPPQQAGTTSLTSTSNSSSRNALDPEIEDQFEVELCWCIQQLEVALNSGKLNERQIQDTGKTLNVLKSGSAPLIKKKQFMRTTFGDYRAKMINDEKKLGRNSAQVKFSNDDNNSNSNSNNLHNSKSNNSVNATLSNKKSIFLRKASITKNDVESSQDNEKDSNHFRIVPTGNTFNFNFNQPEEISHP